MVIPSTAIGIAVLLVLVVPGTVYAAVRTAVGPKSPHDRELTNRVVWAVISSLALNAVYLLALGDWLIELLVRDGFTERPRSAGLVALTLGLVLPALSAYVVHGKPKIRKGNLARAPRLPWPRATTGYSPTPTAWDYAAEPSKGTRWVRVRLADGKWVGGWFGDRSYISTYPEPRDIFIECQHHMDKDGAFGNAVGNSAGVWVPISDDCLVEWIEPR